MKQLVLDASVSSSVGVLCLLVLLSSAAPSAGGPPRDLQVGIAAHAFDHLGSIGDQADAAAASGATIIYASGLGALGYQGLPPGEELARQRQAVMDYLHSARQRGLRLVIGYVCATSIVGLDSFDKNWPAEFRARFRTPPSEWRQQDRQGHPLPSWYAGQYQPACMNNPDWRAYEKFMVRQQLEAGCDGIFFDNPTVHPQGCYCRHCMEQFVRFLQHDKSLPRTNALPASGSLAALRDLAANHPAAFLRFRCTIARDFLAEMRRYARTINPRALITANNSLNSADALYSQCRTHAYNIFEMSQAEDFVVVEDMSSQPRALPGGQTLEYGPTYKQLRAVSHGKPVVAVTLAEADYHTPPSLVRLAMAEAAANRASYLAWPTWPENERRRMLDSIRPQADFLRRHAELLNEANPRRDVLLFLPFRQWLETSQCKVSPIAAALSRANLQYEVICEDQFERKSLRQTQLLLAASRSDFTPDEQKLLDRLPASRRLRVLTADQPDWLAQLQQALPHPSLVLAGPATVRATVCDQPKRTLVHLLNLDIQRLSSFQDRVTPASDLSVSVRVPRQNVRSVRALTADASATRGPLKFAVTKEGQSTLVETCLPRLDIATILVFE